MKPNAVAITKKELTTQVNTDGHMGLVDEPVEIGGLNKGPTPYDLLSASLASCTSITLRLYANRKKWDVSRIRVEVNHNKIYRDDCDGCDEQPIKTDAFERIITIEGNISSKEKERMLEIANKCPVHHTLGSKSIINSKLA